MSQERLNNLAVLAIECELDKQMDSNDILKDLSRLTESGGAKCMRQELGTENTFTLRKFRRGKAKQKRALL